MHAWVDAFAGLLLRFGTEGLLLGPASLVVSLRWLARIERRLVLFWTVSAVTGLCLLLGGVGWLNPRWLVCPLATPVVVTATVAPLAVVPTVVVLAFSARPQRGLEVLHVLCAYACLVSLATLIVIASASV